MVAVVLLGAGASYGSEDVHPKPPPLGNELFDELDNQGGLASRLPEEIKNKFREKFELGMEAYRKWSNDNVMQFQRELAKYLATFTPGANNLYIRLISELGAHRVIYSSLNYDLLFEISAASAGYQPHYSDDYVDDKVRILKIHGSSNFWPQTLDMMHNVIFENSRVDIEAPIHRLNREETLYRCDTEDSVSPAIAIYDPSKAVKVSPGSVKEQYEKWVHAVQQAKKVFVIGVRVNPPDKHIWDVLGDCAAHVSYFGRTGDKALFDEWKSTLRKSNLSFAEKDFAGAIPIIKKRIGL